MDAATKVSLLAVAVAIATAIYAIREAVKANRITVLAGFLSEYRELEPQRYFVLNDLPKTPVRISGLPGDARQKAVAVAYYLDNLGLLVEKGLVSPTDIIQLVGGSIQRQYEKLGPFIELERKARPEPIYMRGFEHLAALAQDQEPVRLAQAPAEFEHLRRYRVRA